MLRLCMSEVASRDLREDTAGVLRRVQGGENITITVEGQPVAMLTPVHQKRRRWLSKAEFLARFQGTQPDRGLRDDLQALAGDATGDSGSIE